MTFYVTVRAINRSFRFAPKATICKALRYCLAVALDKFRSEGKIELYEFEFMSNHYHLLGRDLVGCLPAFIRYLNSLITRELNAIRGINGKNIEQGYGLVRLVGEERIVEQAVYTQANPVAAFLVAKARHWKHVSSRNMDYGVVVQVEKPSLGLWAGKLGLRNRKQAQRSGRARYAGRSKLPAVAELVIDRPPIMLHLSNEELRALIRQRLEQREQEIAQQRQRRGFTVVGWRRAQTVHYLALPKSEEMFARNPTFAASTIAERIHLATIRRAFLKAYAIARDAYRAGNRNAIFPNGTWAMRLFHHCRCEPFAVP